MDLEIDSCSPFTDHLRPGLQFEVDLLFEPGSSNVTDVVPIEVGGRLEACDGTILSQVNEWSEKGPDDSRSFRLTAGPSADENGEQQYSTRLFAPIGADGIEYIDELRGETQRNDVFLNLIVEARVLESRTIISSLQRVDADDLGLELPEYLQDETGSALIAYAWDRDPSPGRNDMWHLSGNRSAEFLGTQRQVEIETDFRIPSREWTDEFLPALGAGQRIIVDIPDPADIVANSEIEKSEALESALEDLKEVQRLIQRGEWPSAVNRLQNVLELIDSNHEPELWELEEVGYTGDAKGALDSIGGNFQGYLGKFRKRREKPGDGGDVRSRTEPYREDVYFMYSAIAGLVQLLAKKQSIRQDDG